MDWSQEIVELHQFFEGWLGGSLAKTEAVYRRFADVMATGFCIVNPSAQLTEREALIEQLYKAHGARPKIRIWIEQPRLHQQLAGGLLASYQECQEIDGHSTKRLSTVLFAIDDTAPNGLKWLHVHETWCA
jgi:hypothetical protein